MKYITLAIIETDRFKLDYRQQLMKIVEMPIGGQGGVNAGEMYRLVKIIDKLEALKDSPVGAPVLALEDGEWDIVNQRVQSFPWPFAHKNFADFCAAIEKASTIESKQGDAERPKSLPKVKLTS